MKKATIYTRNGDNGITHLAGGCKVEKDHPRVEAYGTLDELNAHLGILANAVHNEEKERIFIEKIINNIFSIGCFLAQEKETSSPVSESDVAELENKIDEINDRLSALSSFILPIGSLTSLQANLCRTVCRRAERRIITLSHSVNIPIHIIAYINRLSDYLFTISRLLNDKEEKKWEKY